MPPEDRNRDCSSEWCDKCYAGILREFNAVWANIKGLKKGIWSILILLIANLAGVISILVKVGID